MKHSILLILISLFFVACGDGEERVVPTTGFKVIVPLYKGETRMIDFFVKRDDSYLVQLESSSEFVKNVDVEVSYFASTKPSIKLIGVHEGNDTISVSVENQNGYINRTKIYAYVYDSSLGVDDVDGEVLVEVPDTVDPGEEPDEDGNRRPLPPIIDSDACQENHVFWTVITDDWQSSNTDPEFDPNSQRTTAIRSLIPERGDLGAVSLFVRNDVTISPIPIAMGIFETTTSSGGKVKFDLSLSSAYAGAVRSDGKPSVIYVRALGTCYQIKVPDTAQSPINKTLQPVRAI
jgi:hypothetical protein